MIGGDIAVGTAVTINIYDALIIAGGAMWIFFGISMLQGLFYQIYDRDDVPLKKAPYRLGVSNFGCVWIAVSFALVLIPFLAGLINPALQDSVFVWHR